MSTDPGAPATPAPDAAPVPGDAWAHREDLVAYSRRLLGAHGEMAEDVVQEAYLKLHECAAAGSPVHEPRPWLFRVARNLALDERRRGRRGDDVLTSLEVVSPGPRGPLEVLQVREEAREALEGLDALPPRERRTVILEQAGLAPPAIARRMHTTTNAVHQALFRARRRMRDARTAALGLLPLPLVRLVFRAASSPTLDRLPVLAPGSGGRLAGGAGLAGLVAAAVIGGGAVADRPVVPSPPAPAVAAAAAPPAPGDPVATTVAASGHVPWTARGLGIAARGRAASGVPDPAGVREAPARRADWDAVAAGARGDGPAPHREGSPAGGDDGTGDGRQGRRTGSEGDDDERGDLAARGDGDERTGRGPRADRDEGGRQGAGGRGRSGRDDRDDGDGGSAPAADGGGAPEAGSGPEPPESGGAPEPAEAVTTQEPAGAPVPQEPVAAPPAPDAAGGYAEPAPPVSEPPPPGPAGPS